MSNRTMNSDYTFSKIKQMDSVNFDKVIYENI